MVSSQVDEGSSAVTIKNDKIIIDKEKTNSIRLIYANQQVLVKDRTLRTGSVPLCTSYGGSFA